MQFVQVHIENFRRFSNTVIPFTKSQLILGANDSGKTTIVKAINLALEKEVVDKKDLIDPTQPSKITLNFWDEVSNSLKTLIYSSKGTKGSTTWTTKPVGTDVSIFENIHISIGSTIFEAEKLAQDIVTKNNPELLDRVRSLEEFIAGEIDELLNSDDEEQLMVTGEDSSFQINTRISLKTNIDVGNDYMPLAQKGDGYRRNMALSLLKKLKPNTSLIIIDEIENHLSIPNVANLVERITQHNNVIFTSHRLEAKLNNIVGITFLGENSNDVLGAIDALKIEVGKYNKIILVEGKTDIYYINKFISIKQNTNPDYTAIVVYVEGESQTLNVREGLISKGIDSDKIFAIQDGDQAHHGQANIIYLQRNDIESYRDDFEEILRSNNNNRDLAKSIASMRTSFITEAHPLFEELDRILGE